MANDFMLEILYGIATDPGQRARNEDATSIFVPRSRREAQARGWMFALADGAGGHSSGEVAASRAVTVMAKGFEEAEEQTSLTSLLPRLIQHANAAVYDEALNPQWRHKGMASTMVSCAIRQDQAVISHVGDSRCYLVRDGRAESLTRDHSWVEDQLRQGLISDAEAESSESRNVLTRALGMDRFVTAENTTVTIRAKDTLILCSDGLYAKLGGERLAKLLGGRSDDPSVVAQELVREAVRLDGSDNATALVIHIRSVEATAMYRGRQYVRPAS
jgi:protein phosphatase